MVGETIGKDKKIPINQYFIIFSYCTFNIFNKV